MSWLNRLENIQFTITTGDGKVFTPLWKNSEKSKEFNTSKYEFIDLEGSLVERKKQQSNVHPLLFWFQGEDNIDQAREFDTSSNDNRLWTIEHPFYGTLKGQPVSIKMDDKSYNVTEVSVVFWESLEGVFPNDLVSSVDEVRIKSEDININSLDLLSNSNVSISDIDSVRNNANISGSKFNSDSLNFNNYENIVSTALNSVDNLIISSRSSFLSLQKIITFPSNFEKSVKSRVNEYKSVLNTYKESIDNRFSKSNYEANGASIITGICNSVVNPIENDYITRSDIEEINDLVLDIYEDYLHTLDENQVEIYNIEESWAPNVEIQSLVSDLVFFTSNALFSLSFNARQERFFEVKEDTNLIVLSHRFLGPSDNDENIDIFRKINNIRNNELFKIPKGRTIKYFVR